MNDIHIIGPSRLIKSPDAIPQAAHDVDYIVEPGRYPVSLRAVNWNNVTIEAANDAQPPVFVNNQNREFGLFQIVNGSATLRGLTIEFAGSRGVLAQTHNSANLTIDGCQINAGCLYWGDGGGNVTLRSCYSTGKPWKYLACNFNHRLRSFTFDNSKLPPMLQHLFQGPAEALIRMMEIDQGYLKSIVTVFATKQEIQIRSGGKFCLEDCIAHQVALGWIESELITPPAMPIQLVQFIGGMYDKWPDLSAIQKPAKVAYSKTSIAGQMVNRAA